MANKEGILYRIAEASVKRPDETVRDVVVEQDDDGTIRLNRLNYEMCMFQALREKMRVREIWVEGANRYRNHDNDLPIDFSQKRDIYYEALHQRLLRHCTSADIQKNYVDTHGQSKVAFAFCHLLGFHLLPRLKGIASQKLESETLKQKMVLR
ncbi:MAG: Tn3 family transposase [Deltaproteobacteria bacterium]|nr:Tn3 family transposase [Deltaproteobacteria bacterium]